MRAVLVVAAVGMLASCTDPPPKAPRPTTGEVPANSLDDAKLHGDPARHDDEPSDPTQPFTTKVGEEPVDPSSLSASGSASAKPVKPGPPGSTVSKAECDKAMDKYIGLEIASNPSLKGVPPEVIDQAKEMARQQHGEAPCTATRAQYKCAMSATTTAAWQKCMK